MGIGLRERGGRRGSWGSGERGGGEQRGWGINWF